MEVILNFLVLLTGECAEVSCSDHSCVLTSQLCDGTNDCQNGEDEKRCGKED